MGFIRNLSHEKDGKTKIWEKYRDDSMAVGYNSRSSCYQKWVSPIHSIDRVGDEEHPGWIWIAKSVMQKIDFRKIWLAKSCVFAWDDFHRAEETELKKGVLLGP